VQPPDLSNIAAETVGKRRTVFATCCRRWDLAVTPATRRRGNRV